MTLRQTIQTAADKAATLITKLSATSNQAVKTRERLYAELSDELARYADIEEQQLLPLLRRHPEDKDLAARVLKANKDLRASLETLSGLPKNDNAFIAALAEGGKAFQKHVRNERKELLPAVLKALGDNEATPAPSANKSAAKQAETATRDEEPKEQEQASRHVDQAEAAEPAAAKGEKAERHEEREQAVQAEHRAEEAEHAAAAGRAVVQVQAEQTAPKATGKVADGVNPDTVAAQNDADEAAESPANDIRQVAPDIPEGVRIYHNSAQKMAATMQIVATSSAASVQAVLDVSSVWTDWFSKAARAHTELSQQLLRSSSLKEAAEAQNEFVTSIMQNWMERRTAMLLIAQRTSEQVLSPRGPSAREAA